MILVLGNFAGVFSNLMKLIGWSLTVNEEDSILFYYTNKGENDSPRVLPFQDYAKDINRIFFYRYFEFPANCSLDSFLQTNRMEMGFPEIEKNALPECLQAYPNGFISCSANVYKDPLFPQIRNVYHEHLTKRLPFTPLMTSFLQNYLDVIRAFQASGKRILAVFLRWTPHFGSFDSDNVFQELKQIAPNYDYILPITQLYSFYEETLKLFGEKCISFPRAYLKDNVDWCRPMSDDEYEDEFRCAIRDVYLASQCDFLLGGPSNLFLGALIWNPSVPFKVFDELSSKNGG
jgi:hypothetical protein